MADLMAAAVPATPTKTAKAASGAVPQQQIVVQLPAQTVKAMKQRALDRDTTLRVVLLEALANAGLPVPAGQARDFRKVR